MSRLLNQHDPLATVNGYVYRGALYCSDCISDAVTGETRGQGTIPTETILDILADEKCIIRSDESSYDSFDFPKVITEDLHDSCSYQNGYYPGQCADRCEECHDVVDNGNECPNTKDDPIGLILSLRQRDDSETYDLASADLVRVSDSYGGAHLMTLTRDEDSSQWFVTELPWQSRRLPDGMLYDHPATAICMYL